MLAIEVDGASHDFDDTKPEDREPQARIENYGISFLRFTDEEVIIDLNGVVLEIEKWIERHRME